MSLPSGWKQNKGEARPSLRAREGDYVPKGEVSALHLLHFHPQPPATEKKNHQQEKTKVLSLRLDCELIAHIPFLVQRVVLSSIFS